VARWEAWMDGTVVQISGGRVITGFISKAYFDFADKDSYYKTVNIYKFSKNFSNSTYIPFLEAYCKAMGNNEYYEQVLRVITMLDCCELKACVLENKKWYEIDDAQDKDIAESLFAENPAERLRLVARRYGGYWRYPSMLDFCYLVNPGFPSKQLLNELKSFFCELLTEYPSGLNVQNLLAAKLFNVDEENILTGNGAAELIRAAAPVFAESGERIGIVYPTFNEYGESAPQNASIVPLFPPPEISSDSNHINICYTKDNLIEWSANCDTLILINPDNPSGNYIPYDDVITLLDHLKQNNKRLVLDESFIDFCDYEEQKSLLRDDVLHAYPNLTVIKSLSKSYGIPGIRLGVLASGDKKTIAAIRKQIPIWNINSFAEYFLQIIGKYTKDYKAACISIAAERARLKIDLDSCGLFTVYPSQANYFLCRCKNFSAQFLAQYLLEHHSIFIKDLTGKRGIAEDAFIRLAIRSRDDNVKLVAALTEFKEELQK
jgi:histidinol-phosphate/aromatic aminotransferase/cobyric acid decarboxylase-like protein